MQFGISIDGQAAAEARAVLRGSVHLRVSVFMRFDDADRRDDAAGARGCLPIQRREDQIAKHPIDNPPVHTLPRPEAPMIRISRIAVPVAALLLAACGGDARQTAAPPPDSANMVKAAEAVPGAMGGATARAQEGADSSNAAVQRRDAEVDALTREANGAGTGAATTP
jgi:hypothetical protein